MSDVVQFPDTLSQALNWDKERHIEKGPMDGHWLHKVRKALTFLSFNGVIFIA